jgi:predicted LPLAT superfamily acyltransferase
VKELFYRALSLLSRNLGTWFFEIVAGGIATGYFLVARHQVSAGINFYRALFPGRSEPFYKRCVWRQFHNFTSIFRDRLAIDTPGSVTYTSQGWRHLEAARERQQGGVLLMSHLGNWEIAAHLFKSRQSSLPLLLFMGIKQKEQIERMQKEDLRKSGIKIVPIGKDDSAPMAILDGVSFLKQGGFVSITGDVLWHPGQRRIPAQFLGHRIYLPETPHVLALMAGVPLFPFFTSRVTKQHYRFTICSPIELKAAQRSERRSTVESSVQAYAGLLEKHLRQNPFEWYHFDPFLHEPLMHKGLY